jgi:magnesium transporter
MGTQATEVDAAGEAMAVEFDFETRTERKVPARQAAASCAAGKFCWVDLDERAAGVKADEVLRLLEVNEHAVAEAIGPDVDGRHDVYEECLHIAVTSAELRSGELVTSHVDMVIGERFLVTVRRGRVEFIEEVRRKYRKDFQQFARTPSFLLYEVFDALTEGYRRTLRGLAEKVERLQGQIFGEVSDAIFNEVSEATRDLLSFRKVMNAAREVLHELSTRRSPFVAESTQPFLDRMVATLERLGSDLAVEREILAESLNLYMGIVSHRTNKIVNRLTVLSTIFLPLTFLCGVYGMNFGEGRMPELGWRYGYAAFWVVSLVIAVTLLIFMKRKRWW